MSFLSKLLSRFNESHSKLQQGWGLYCHCFNTKLQTGCKTCMKMQRPKNNKCWSWSSNTLVTWCKEPTHWKRPWWGKGWGQEEKGETEDKMVGRHQWLSGHAFEQAPGDSEGQGSLACCSPWGCKEPLDMTEQLNKPLHPLYWQQFNKLTFLTAGRPKQLENEGPTGLTPPVNHPQSPTLVGESLQGANHTVQLSIWQW